MAMATYATQCPDMCKTSGFVLQNIGSTYIPKDRKDLVTQSARVCVCVCVHAKLHSEKNRTLQYP